MKEKKGEPIAASIGSEFTIGDDKFVVGTCGCKGAPGNWVCTACGESFINQFDKDRHISKPGEHVLAWNCHTHGPVQP